MFKLLLAALFAVAVTSAHAEQIRVDTQLVLAVDVSGSINTASFRMQTEGIAAALTDPRFMETIQRGRFQRIGITYMQWSGMGQQHASQWVLIQDEHDARAFAQLVLSTPRAFRDGTIISDALRAAGALIERSPFEADRTVIDVSGDGMDTFAAYGEFVTEQRDALLSMGYIINGLPIINDEPFIADYYRDNVVGGFGSFLIVATGFQDIARAFLQKLLLEIS